MRRIVYESLTYREELKMAVIYLNLEKLKYLLAMDIFDEDCLLTNEVNEAKQRYPLYVINLCYSYIFTQEPYKCLAEKNNAMLAFWHERFGLPMKNDKLLVSLYDNKERLKLKYYKDSFQFRWLCSCVSENDGYKFLFSKESADSNIHYSCSMIVHQAMMIKMAKALEDKGANLHYDSEAESLEHVKSLDENDLDERIISFIAKHDNEGEELALYDDDKATNLIFWHSKQFAAMLKRLLLTKYLKIRIGGNSFRIGDSIRNMAKTLGVEGKVLDFDVYFKDEQFVWGSPLIDYADKFDFRTQQANSAGSRSMVWFYVNNVDCGWYNKDGSFTVFNNNIKGYWQIVEVLKSKGYKSTKPASCALICGEDPRIAGKQQAMFEEEGIDFINVIDRISEN